MSFPRYPKYEDSGVEWLGTIPEHWELMKLRRLCTIQKRIANSLGHEVLSVTQQGIRIKDTESNDGQLSMDYSKYQLVDVGDFAMNHMDLLTGWIDIATFAGVTSPDYRVFKANQSRTISQYLLYLLQMGYENQILFAYGQGSSHLGRWRLPTDSFNDLLIPVPPIGEQEAIVGFLSRELSRIDSLISAQRRLIDLLREKCRAVVSQAVTKGLNPNAPTKPSGVDWLGDMPAHWRLTPLKHLALVGNSGSYGDEPECGQLMLPVATTAQIDADGKFDVEQMPRRGFSVDDASRYSCVDGDILIVKSSGSATNIISGKAGIVDATTPRFVFSNFLMRARPNQALLAPRFGYLLLRTPLTRNRVERMCSTTTYPNLDVGEYVSALLPIPPRDEQDRIVEFCKTVTAASDALIAEAKTAKHLLEERRAALITAAVTGKIDVRNYAAGQAEAA